MTVQVPEPHARDITLSTGLEMRYYEWPGTGPVMILLHSSSGYGRQSDFLVRYLHPDFHIYAPDQRGHGDSGAPDGGYTGEEYAEDLRALCEGLGLGKVIVTGHSLGGRAATIFAGTYPNLAQAIILIGGPHYDSYFQVARRVESRLRAANAVRTSQRVFPNREEAYLYLKGVFPYDNQLPTTEELIQHRLTHNFRQLSDGNVMEKNDPLRGAQTLAHISDDLKRYASQVLCPVAFVLGSQGTHLTREQAEKVRPFFTQAKVHVYETDGDYGLQRENPEGLGRVVREFVGKICS